MKEATHSWQLFSRMQVLLFASQDHGLKGQAGKEKQITRMTPTASKSTFSSQESAINPRPRVAYTTKAVAHMEGGGQRVLEHRQDKGWLFLLLGPQIAHSFRS